MKKTLFVFGLLAALCCGDFKAGAQAKLVAYRKGCIYGALAGYQVRLDGKKLVTLKGSRVFTADITPGAHTISAKQAKRYVTINAEPGQTYVVVYKTRIGIFGARPKLKLVTVDQEMKDSKYFRTHYKKG